MPDPSMTGAFLVHHLEPELIQHLRQRAAHHGRSVEAELREILRHALSVGSDVSVEDMAADLRALAGNSAETPSEVM